MTKKKKPKTGVVMQVSPGGAKTVKRLEGGPARRDDIDPPHDHRGFLGRADHIIEEVKKPVLRSLLEPGRRALPLRPRKGVDLGPKRDELAHLLANAAEIYQWALDDWETRRDLNKPKKQLPASLRGEVEGFPDWDKWWDEVYHSSAGPPGIGWNNLPTLPLHPVRWLVGKWWREHVAPRFDPRYPVAYDGARRDDTRDMPLYQPAARLLLLVAKTLNPDYSAMNCDALRETRKKQRLRQRHRSE